MLVVVHCIPRHLLLVLSLINDYVAHCHAHVLGMAAEVLHHHLEGREGGLKFAVHLVADKIEPLIVAEFLPPRVLALGDVLIVEAPENLPQVREDHQTLLALQAHL